jgi:hypothetical protein
LGVPQKSGLKVGYVNLEDTGDEQDRRARAIIDHYGVDDSALGVRLFRLEDGAGLKVVKLQDGTVTRCEDVDTLKDAISSNRLDILYVDPFVSVHDVPENDNNAINAAIKVLAQVANDTSCAIHVVHHTTKQGDRALSQDSARGASAFVDGLRAARGVSTLTEAQAKKFGVGADYRAHKRIVSLKGNNSPGGHTAWFRLESVQLGQGDSVGVPVGWLPPQQRVTVFDPGQRAAVLEVFAEDAPNHFSCQSGHWVGHRICKALGEDSGTVEGKAIANKWIETLSEEGLIEKRSAPDKTSSRGSRPVWVSTSAQGFSDLESDVPK